MQFRRIIIKTKISIYEVLCNTTKSHSNDVALIYKNKKITYKKLLLNVNKVAYKLNELGFKKDDVIIIILPNIPFSVYLLYAINQIGAIANLIHPLMKYDQLHSIIEKNKSKIIFCLDANYQEFANLEKEGVSVVICSPCDELNPIIKKVYHLQNKKDLKNINKSTKTSKDFIGDGVLTTFDKDYLKDSFYLHSGGTTGSSKTIALSNYSLNALASNGGWIMGINDGINTFILSVLPMFHGFGLPMGIHTELMWGGTDMLIPKFSAKETINYIKKKQMTYLLGVPILYEALLRNKKFNGKKLRTLYIAFVGGDFVSKSLIDRFNNLMIANKSQCRLFEGYGLTETVTVCSVNTHFYNKNGTVGKMLPNTKAKIMSLDGKSALGFNEKGEIYIGGETLMNGYRFDENLENPICIDKNGEKWIRTGDYGSLTSDNFLIFKQRIKRIIKVNGINVFPSDVENSCKKLPCIFECAAVSVDDEKHGHLVLLYVVLDRAYSGEKPNKEIKEIIEKDCGIYAVPKEIIYLSKFDKTLVGKIDVKKL